MQKLYLKLKNRSISKYAAENKPKKKSGEKTAKTKLIAVENFIKTSENVFITAKHYVKTKSGIKQTKMMSNQLKIGRN